jgi:pilus assembly protein CpaE
VPDVPIIVLSDVADESLALDAVREGAQDYLVKGRVPAEGLARCVRYAIERHRNRQEETLRQERCLRRGRVLSFLGAKGGVGVSTIALNVACALGRMGNSTLAAELRSYSGTFAHLLRRLPPPAATYEDPRPWASPFGFSVLFGPAASQELEISAERAEAVVKDLGDLAQCVVLDLPPHPSEANRAAIRISDFVGLVTEREPSSLFAAEAALERLRGYAPQAPVGVVVVNRVPLSNPVGLPDIAVQLGQPVVGVVPPAADGCMLAQKIGKPLVVVQPESLFAGSLTDLARRLAATPLCVANCF